MSKIVLSAGVRQNLLSLQTTAEMMATTQVRLATGKKVNSALDNPTNFFTSAALQNRAGELNSLLDSMSIGMKTLEATDNGIKAITKTIETMQSTLRQARQDKSFKTESYGLNLPGTLTGTEQLSFTGGSVGDTAINIALTKPGPGTAATNAVATGTSALGSISTQGGPPENAVLSGTSALAAYDASGGTVSFDINGQTVTLADNGGAGNDGNWSASDIVAAINNQVGGTANVQASLGTGGELVLTSTDTAGATDEVEVDNFTGGMAAADLGLTATGASGSAGPAGTALSFEVNGETVTLAADADYTAADIVTAINNQVGTSAGVAASLDANGNLVLASTGTAGAADEVTVGNFSSGDATQLGFAGATVGVNGADAAPGGPVARTVDEIVAAINNAPTLKGKVRAANDNGRLRIENQATGALTIGGISTAGEVTGGAGTVDIGGNEVRRNLVKQFNELRDQLDKMADDASFNGINILRGDKLKITFNENASSTLEIQAKDVNGNETTVNAASLGIFGLTDSEVDADASIDDQLSTLSTALNTIRSHASNFGSNLSIVENRTEFTRAMINTLETGADKLVLADTNEEAANMLALQTRQQLSSTALSLASQADQAVLRLFG